MMRGVTAFAQVKCTSKFDEANSARFFSSETCMRLGYQVRLGLASMLQYIPNLLVPEILVLIASTLGEAATSAQTILRMFHILMMFVPYSLAAASTFYIGKSIGEKNKTLAQYYFRLSLWIGLFLGLMFLLFVWSCEHAIHRYFTNQEEVIAELEYAWPMMLVFAVLDSLYYATSGGLRAAGL